MLTMKKWFQKIVLFIAFAVLLAAVSFTCQAEDEPIRIYALTGPTGIGLVDLMKDDAYEFTLVTTPDAIVSAIASGSADIAACPTNLAAALYQRTGGNVQLLALNTLGVLYVVTADEDIQSIEDLSGRTVFATGQAAVPEYVIEYILEKNGLADSVTVEYIAEHSALATMLAAGTVEIGILPEPHVTSAISQNGELRRALDLTALFEDAAHAAGSEDMVLSMGCAIVRRDFAQEHPDEIRAFLDAYSDSVDFVNADPVAAAAEVEACGVMPKAAIAQAAIPNCHIVFIEGDDMRAQIEPFYALLLKLNPRSIGGVMPGDDFYYNAN